MSDFSRGDIYYVNPSYSEVGHEMWSGRPAVIVSSDEQNRRLGVVEVVYLTTRPKENIPTHVIIYATGRMSTAICEQITSVDKVRMKDGGCKCTPKEMAMIDDALRMSLNLPASVELKEDSFDALSAGLNALRKNSSAHPPVSDDETSRLRIELAKAEAALATYKTLCADLLDRLSMVSASA